MEPDPAEPVVQAEPVAVVRRTGQNGYQADQRAWHPCLLERPAPEEHTGSQPHLLATGEWRLLPKLVAGVRKRRDYRAARPRREARGEHHLAIYLASHTTWNPSGCAIDVDVVPVPPNKRKPPPQRLANCYKQRERAVNLLLATAQSEVGLSSASRSTYSQRLRAASPARHATSRPVPGSGTGVAKGSRVATRNPRLSARVPPER
jgi:hypothetical protein